MNEEKIVVFTGAGVSAESGLRTFRDPDGLWNQHNPEELATPQAWEANPELVLDFYNYRRKQAFEAKPNPAHLAIAALQEKFDVIVITQNVDDLHERAGSEQVIHLHGELREARSTIDPMLILDIGDLEIRLGDRCPLGSQLRPNVVWFGEEIKNYSTSTKHFRAADRVLIVGTSLSVFPAAGLVKLCDQASLKVHISKDRDKIPYGFKFLHGKAGQLVPEIAHQWLGQIT